MAKQIAQLAETGRWGREWQTAPGWESHTVLRAEADRIAAGYIQLLKAMGQQVAWQTKRGLGIGSGAGHLEAALATHGIDMVASEWNEDGVSLIQSQNPAINCRTVDLMSFDETKTWDLIVCREVYPFTRTNAFSQQLELVYRLLDALRPAGVLLLIGSDVSKPHCLDYKLMMRSLRSDPRVAEVFGPVLEPLVKRMRWNPVGKLGYRLLNVFAELALITLNRLRHSRIAGIRVYAIRKSA